MIPECANGPNKSKETKDTTEVESMAGRVVHTGVHACVSESWQMGKIEMLTKIIAHKDKRFQHYWWIFNNPTNWRAGSKISSACCAVTRLRVFDYSTPSGLR